MNAKEIDIIEKFFNLIKSHECSCRPEGMLVTGTQCYRCKAMGKYFNPWANMKEEDPTFEEFLVHINEKH